MCKLLIEEAPQQELPLPGKKHNRHVTIALNHLSKRRDVLIGKRAELNGEIEEIDAAILALE